MESSNSKNIGTSIAVAFGFLFMLVLPFQWIFSGTGLSDFQQEYLGDTLKNCAIILFGIILIRSFGYAKISGISTLKIRHAALVVIPLYFVFAGPLQYWIMDFQFQQINQPDVWILFVAMLSVGVSEEIVFRGFILPHLIHGNDPSRSLRLPILLAASFFGVLHFLNLLQADSHFISVLAQVTYATMFGVAFGVILLRTGTIYPLGFLHGVINFSGNWDDLPGAVEPTNLDEFRIWEAILSVLIVLPFFLYMWKQIPKIDKLELAKRLKA